MRILKYIVLGIGLLTGILLTSGFSQTDAEVDSTLHFKNLQGEWVPLQNYTGEMTIVNLWSTWSASCIKEMPVLERIYQDYYAQNIKVVGIAVFSDTSKIGRMLHLTKVSYPILIASQKQIKAFGNLSIIPQTFILDAHGRVLKHYTGSQPFSKLDKVLRTLLENRCLTKNLN